RSRWYLAAPATRRRGHVCRCRSAFRTSRHLSESCPVCTAVPAPGVITDETVAEGAPGAASDAEAQMNRTLMTYPTAARGPGLVVRRFSESWRDATLDPGCRRHHLRCVPIADVLWTSSWVRRGQRRTACAPCLFPRCPDILYINGN